VQEGTFTQKGNGISDRGMFVCDHVVTFVDFSRICALRSPF